MNELIRIKNLRKTFSSGFCLKDINFFTEKPTTFCILGKNGAGKSTLFQLMTGNLEPDSGEIRYNGELMLVDHYQIKRKIAYLPQKPALPLWVTPEEVLQYTACLHSLENMKENIKKNLDYWDCKEYSNRSLATCSHGMQKRVSLAITSLYDPEFLILDEPFSGLDLSHIYSLENYIERRKKEQKTTLLSTHIAPYAAKLCDEAYLLSHGELKKIDIWATSSYEDRLTLIRNYFTVMQEPSKIL